MVNFRTFFLSSTKDIYKLPKLFRVEFSLFSLRLLGATRTHRHREATETMSTSEQRNKQVNDRSYMPSDHQALQA